LQAPARFELTYHRSAELPAAKLWIFDATSTLIDLSGYTFSLKVGKVGAAASLTKSSSITGATGSGTSPSGTPNVTIAWSSGELNLTPGVYDATLTGTSGGLDRVWAGTITIVDVVS
jgi:hypothetical protein